MSVQSLDQNQNIVKNRIWIPQKYEDPDPQTRFQERQAPGYNFQILVYNILY